MLLAGVTGGIGSGKSTVCGIFAQLGVPVFHADEVGRQLLTSDKKVIRGIKKLFGKDIIENGEVNRKQIAVLVFKDKKKLNSLNSIIHPEVRKRFHEWVREQTAPWVIEEAAILVESGYAKALDALIVVTAPQTLRIKRVMERNTMKREEVIKRIANQMPQTALMKQAGYVIINDDKTLVIPQALALFNELNKKSVDHP